MDFLEHGNLIHCNTIHELWQYIINPVTNWEGRKFITEIEHTACDTLILYTVVNGEKIKCCTIYPHVNTGWFTLVFNSGLVCPEIWQNIKYCRDPRHSTIFTKPSSLANILSMAIKKYKEENKKDMSNYSEKLGKFRERLIDMLHTSYPDYVIRQYNNGLGRIPWLCVVDSSNNLRIAEVMSVEKFGPEDTMDNTLLVIDYVNSDSTTHKYVDSALNGIECILKTASEKKKACEIKAADERQEEDTIHLESLRDNKFYLYTGRRNGKTLFMQNLLNNVIGFNIKNVIFNDPATIVFWEDGGKTVVQCQNGEEFDPEKGLAMAISKRVYGNDYNYYEVFKKWIGKYSKKKFKEALAKAMEITPDEIIRDGHRYALVKDGTEVTDNGVISNLKLSDSVVKPYCDIKIDKPEDNNK